MGNKTVLYAEHVRLGAKLVDFAGWEMPLHYGSQVQEHHQVRRDVGMFDVSHMTIIDIAGRAALPFLRSLLANDVGRLTEPGKALYSCMLNERGGVIDDLIVYYLAQGHYRLVVNAATREKDLNWIGQRATGLAVTIQERRDLAMIAIQGPNARSKVKQVCSAAQRVAAEQLRRFYAAESGDALIARTGYTGEDGYEVILPEVEAISLWRALHQADVAPCGLGARDTLRLEAGMNLYGADMDEQTSPLVSNLAWTVAWEPTDREFVGRAALESQRRQPLPRKLVGLVLERRGVMRSHQKVITKNGAEGEITSGGFSPTLGKAIALARLPTDVGTQCMVEMRNGRALARVVKPPFVRNGKPCI